MNENEENFYNWLMSSKGLSSSSASKYKDAIKGIFSRIVNQKIFDSWYAENLANKLLNNEEFITLNKKGNNMYSCALKHFVEFKNDAAYNLYKINVVLNKVRSKNLSTEIENPSDTNQVFIEGKTKEITINKYERNKTARNACIEIYGYKCQVCGFDFNEVYGDLGKNFIHVHHIIPLSECKENYQVNPEADLIPVCPNCHAMLHRLDGEISVEELKFLISSGITKGNM